MKRPSVFMALIVATCLSCRPHTPVPPPSPADATTAAPADAGSAADASTPDEGIRSTVPTHLQAMERNAEGLSEKAAIDDWPTAQAILDQAKAHWVIAGPDAKAKGGKQATLDAIGGALASLTTDVSNKASRATQTRANSISMNVPDLFELYTDPIPSDALRLDSAFRQLQIDVTFDDYAAGKADVAKLKEIWLRLRPLAVPAAARRTEAEITGSSTVIRDVDACTAAADAAVNSASKADGLSQAQRGLDLVDVVEHLF